MCELNCCSLLVLSPRVRNYYKYKWGTTNMRRKKLGIRPRKKKLLLSVTRVKSQRGTRQFVFIFYFCYYFRSNAGLFYFLVNEKHIDKNHVRGWVKDALVLLQIEGHLWWKPKNMTNSCFFIYKLDPNITFYTLWKSNKNVFMKVSLKCLFFALLLLFSSR